MRYRQALLAAAAIGGCLTYQPANAALIVTAAGVADGFSLSTFYSGDPSNFYGLLDVANGNAGQVIATSYARSRLELLNDVDGQTPGTVLLTSPVVPGVAYGIATTPSGVYYAGAGAGYYSVNPTTLALTKLTLQQVSGQNPVPFLGLWANPVTGHLISSSEQGLIDIDPVTGATHQITTQTGFDGVTVSPDGLTACGEIGGGVRCYTIAGTNALVKNFNTIGHSPDGTGFITGGALNGDIIVNNNDGTVGVVDYATGVETILASGGTRGDFVSPDLSNGTLFLASADQVERLTLAGASIGCGANCGPPTPTSAVPEPTTLALLGLGFVSLAFVRRRI
jgi:hypothetical protein